MSAARASGRGDADPTLRRIAWAGFAVYVAAEALVFYPPVAARVGAFIQGLPFALVYLAAAVTAAVNATRASGRERRLWTYLALGTGLQTAAELLISAQQFLGMSLAGQVTASSVGGLLSLAATGSVFALIFSMSPLSERPIPDRILAGLDVLAFVLLGVVAAQYMITGPLLGGLGVAFDAQVLAASRIVLGLTMMGGVAFNVFGFTGDARGSWERTLSIGVGLLGLGVLLWPLWYVGAIVYHRDNCLFELDTMRRLADACPNLIGFKMATGIWNS